MVDQENSELGANHNLDTSIEGDSWPDASSKDIELMGVEVERQPVGPSRTKLKTFAILIALYVGSTAIS